MVQDGLINKIKSASTDQKRGYDLESTSEDSIVKKLAQKKLLDGIRQVGQSGDLETILAAENNIGTGQYKKPGQEAGIVKPSMPAPYKHPA